MDTLVARKVEKSIYHIFLPELSFEDSETMIQWICLPREQYHELLQLVY